MKEDSIKVEVERDKVVLSGWGWDIELTPDAAWLVASRINIAARNADSFIPPRITAGGLCDLCSEKSPEEIVKLVGADKELFFAVVRYNVELGEYGYARELLDAWEVS